MNNHKDVIYNVVVWNNVVLMYLSVLSVSENPSSYLPIKYSRKFVYAPEVFCFFPLCVPVKWELQHFQILHWKECYGSKFLKDCEALDTIEIPLGSHCYF